MDCREFLDRFSQFYDGDPDLADREACEAHLERCVACSRYLDVVTKGAGLLREVVWPVSPSADFRRRLEHRIFHVADEEALLRGPSGSGTTTITALSLALLLAVAAWSPVLHQRDVEVDLPVIVVGGPDSPLEPATTPDLHTQTPLRVPPALQNASLWRDAGRPLYHFSPLSDFSQGSGMVRAGLE